MVMPEGSAAAPAKAPFDLAYAASALIDGEGTIIGWTAAAEHLLGYPAAEALHRPAAQLLASPGQAARAAEVAAQWHDQDIWGGLVAARHRDGRRIELGLRVSALASPDGHERWLVSAIDLARTPSWAVSSAILEGFLSRSPIGMAVLTPDLRYVWVNDTLERLAGVPREHRIGMRMSDSLPGLDTEALENIMREVLLTGEPVIDHEYQGWTLAAPYRERSFSTSFYRLDDAEGRVMGVCYMGMDVTDRWRARGRLALLNEAGACIGSTLDVTRTAQELADVSVPRLADFVTVDLLEPVLRGDEPPAGGGLGRVPLRRAGMRSVHPGTPESIVALGERINAGETSPHVRCMTSGRPEIEADIAIDRASWLTDDPARAAKIREFGMRSVMWVPLRARGTVLGVVTFIRHRRPGAFEPDDLLLAEELVARAAVCVDNARRWTREHEAALTLQRSLLPQTLTGGTALEVASRYLPTDIQDGVGGDWFDVIPLSGARIALVVGDVVGHGLTAAATMGRLRTAVHTLADMDLPPDELLAHLDDLIMRLTEEESADASVATTVTGATCLYAVYDPVTRRLTMARAGHPPPAVVDPSGRVTFAELPAGPPLGLGAMPFESAELELAEGSIIALYTDGLIDTFGEDVDVGLERLAHALAHPELPLQDLCSAVLERLLPGPPADDVALLVARTHALTTDRFVAWDLPVDPAVVSRARALAARQLAEWGLEELRTTTELVVSELVTNAIRHASGPIRLRLIRQSVFICEVYDGSNTVPRLRHARTTDEGGRGLFLVAQLTRRWGTRYTADGKLIWAEQEIPDVHPG
ncbi:SpoIIE family protein phosphatase [Streptomyces sp. PA03-1a]|nr:SpoIIE family protein phosphatase [Streptomyces sp. PA03-1a]MDX2812021.1 SpoIIE family protein phosphatase [Streptomyces sp. PA03-5A]